MVRTCASWRSSLLGFPWGSACEPPSPDRHAVSGSAAETFHLKVYSFLFVLAFAVAEPS